jgi:GSH-dependent disulfide-bond oxidoreductase
MIFLKYRPMTGACYGHFYAYAPPDLNRDYGVARYGMEVQRLCSVLDQHLADKKYICGNEYTIADMICMPWFDLIRDQGYQHPQTKQMTRDFLNMKQYKNANRWADMLLKRPQVKRGMVVCRKTGKPWLDIDRFKHLARL